MRNIKFIEFHIFLVNINSLFFDISTVINILFSRVSGTIGPGHYLLVVRMHFIQKPSHFQFIPVFLNKTEFQVPNKAESQNSFSDFYS